jgi:hypothetical protein
MWKGSHSTEGEVASRIVHNHIWVNLASVTCLEWFIRQGSFVLQAQPLDVNLLSY